MATINETLRLNDAFSSVYDKYINYTDKAETATSKLTNTIKSVAGAYLGMQGLKALVNMSDQITSTTARLDMMNDGLQTTAELNDMIFESANRSRGAYMETANLVTQLGKMAGDAFDSPPDIVAFAAQLN